MFNAFKKRYGAEDGKRIFFAYEDKNPETYKKALKTAKKNGDKIVKLVSKKKK